LVHQLDAADEAQLRAVSFKLKQNERLLAAAQTGVGDAVTKLRQLQSSRTSLSSYDKSGRATEIRPTANSTDRRF